jgi:hypothetical protein
MSRRTDWFTRRRWLPLGGGHRARGHCEVAFDLLRATTAPAYQPKVLRQSPPYRYSSRDHAASSIRAGLQAFRG